MNGYDGVLVQTKLHAPRRRQGLLRRSRLDERLAPAAVPPVVLVSAPAGFGKTTLLAQWATQADDSGLRTAWLSLDRRDSDPVVFWSYVIAALRKIDDELGTAALGTLQFSPTGVDAVVGALVNDLAARDDIVLVLDDYHAIESIDVHESMQFFVDRLPPTVHLVVATRADPPWPLASLRARGDLLEIRAADLRFTPSEAEAYLNDAVGLGLTSQDIEVLEVRTEGWIAALQLAAISLRGRDDRSTFIAEFAGDDRFVVDYLADEVLNRQPADVRSFLLETSILTRLSAELCAAVTGRSEAGAILQSLERSNMFLVALDDRRHWYRYHHLFADVLRACLADERADAVPDLHRRASAWYAAHADDAEAVAHAMAAGDSDRAAQLIELAAPELRRRRQEKTLRQWLEALPADRLTDRPVLAISLAGARMATGDTAGVESLLDTVEAALGSSTPPIVFDEHEFAGLPAQVLVYRAALALLAGDMSATTAHATAALDLVAPTDQLRRGSASALLALAHWTSGDLDTAERLYTGAVRALIDADHLPDALGCSLALADIQIARGRLTDATRTLDAGLRLTAAHPGLRGAADMHIGLSEVLIERNDLDAATHHLQTSAELGDSAGLPQHAYRWRVTKARLCRARGDLEAGLALIDEAAPLYDTDFSPPVRPVAAIRARVQLAQGELAAAATWIDDREIGIADELSYVHEYEHVTLARILIAQHAAGHHTSRLDDAIALLDRLLVAAERGGRTGSIIEIRILQASAHQAHGDAAAALATLDDALRRAEPEGHVRLFLHAGPDVTALLRSIGTRPNLSPHTKRVLAALPVSTARSTSTPVPALVEELSPRELDVLRLLRTELSGPEIAAELVVSLNTVRSHTKSIFTKLAVTNRRSAVRRADELGL
jgi:ATP/maltotriose-dependent transcriptional regulator MalT